MENKGAGPAFLQLEKVKNKGAGPAFLQSEKVKEVELGKQLQECRPSPFVRSGPFVFGPFFNEEIIL